jgi:hypothetical protein
MAARKKAQPSAEAATNTPTEEGVITVTNAAIVPAKPLPVVRSADIKTGKNKTGTWAKLVEGDKSILGYVSLTDRDLDALERVVVSGLKGFIKAGEALLEIRVRKLYEEAGYTSFITYGIERFGLSKARLYQLIDIAQVSAILVAAGEPLPALAVRLEPLGRLKDNPDAVVAAAQQAADASPDGTLDGASQADVKDAVSDVAAEEGRALADGSNMRERAARVAPPSDEEEEEEEGYEEEEEEDDADVETDTDKEERAPSRRVSTGPRGVSLAPSTGPTPEEQALAELITVVNGFRGGRYSNMYTKTANQVQAIAGLALAYLAQEWETQKVGNGTRVSPLVNRPLALVISKTTAKRMVKALLDAQGTERERKEGDDAQDKKAADKAADKAAKAEAQAKATEAKRLNDLVREGLDRIKEGEVIDGPDPALTAAYAITDAMTAWKDAGSAGQAPFSGTDVRRVEEFMDAVTTPEEETEEEETEETEETEEEVDVEGDDADDADDFDLEEEEVEEAAPAGGR